MNALEYRFAKIQFKLEARLSFYQELAGLLRAEMSKARAIENLYMVASHEGRRKGEPTAIVLRDVLRSMRDGAELGVALRKWVPRDESMVIEAAEGSNDFPRQLDAFCESLRAKARIRSSIIGGLAYPVVLFVMVYGMLTYFGREVVPVMGSILPPERWAGPAALLAHLASFAEHAALPTAVGIVVGVIIVWLSLPRWAGRGRRLAEHLPVYGLYRTYTGISFLISLASLLEGGMATSKALDRIRVSATPYVRYRVDRIRLRMLNGADLGTAIAAAGTDWPDKRLNLAIKIFAQTQELSEQLMQLSSDWLQRSEKRVKGQMTVIQGALLVFVFGVVILVVLGVYGLQDQLAQEVNRR